VWTFNFKNVVTEEEFIVDCSEKDEEKALDISLEKAIKARLIEYKDEAELQKSSWFVRKPKY
jgi:hypothetical protein